MASLGVASRFLRRPAANTFPAAGRLFSTTAAPPEIQLEFLSPTPESDGEYTVEKVTAASCEKRLRNIMLDNNIDLYATFRKVVNCGGRGLCGTCMVEILEGMDLLSEKTKAEYLNVKKKPESWRLACQTIVGNKDNSGKIFSLENIQILAVGRDCLSASGHPEHIIPEKISEDMRMQQFLHEYCMVIRLWFKGCLR